MTLLMPPMFMGVFVCLIVKSYLIYAREFRQYLQLNLDEI